MKISYLGHSCILVEEQDTSVLIDPFLSGNPLQKKKFTELQADLIVLTHGHGDHVGDAVAIARRNQAPIVAVPELCRCLAVDTGYDQFVPLGLGGSYAFKTIHLKFYPAFHGTGYIDQAGNQQYAGMPASVVLSNQTTAIYHAGDTCLFSDMKLIAADYVLDLAILPVGDRYTMGVTDALKAFKLLQARQLLPVHFNTFPEITINTTELRQAATDEKIPLAWLEINQSLTL